MLPSSTVSQELVMQIHIASVPLMLTYHPLAIPKSELSLTRICLGLGLPVIQDMPR